MKLSKYFLSAFAFIAAIGGSIASTSFDYYISGGNVVAIASLAGCELQAGMTCQVETSSGTFVDTWDEEAQVGNPFLVQKRQ